jgi:hypothetical protein
MAELFLGFETLNFLQAQGYEVTISWNGTTRVITQVHGRGALQLDPVNVVDVHLPTTDFDLELPFDAS